MSLFPVGLGWCPSNCFDFPAPAVGTQQNKASVSVSALSGGLGASSPASAVSGPAQ